MERIIVKANLCKSEDCEYSKEWEFSSLHELRNYIMELRDTNFPDDTANHYHSPEISGDIITDNVSLKAATLYFDAQISNISKERKAVWEISYIEREQYAYNYDESTVLYSNGKHTNGQIVLTGEIKEFFDRLDKDIKTFDKNANKQKTSVLKDGR